MAPASDVPFAGTAPAPAAPDIPSFLDLANRLKQAGSYGECAVEALRYAYQHPADREVGFDRAALCLSLAGRFGDARRLMLAAPAMGATLGGLGRLRICLTEVFMPEIGEPVCPALVAAPPGDALGRRGRHALLMREIWSRRWAEAEAGVAAAPSPSGDATLAAWQEQDRLFLRRYQTLPRKSPWLAAGLSAVVPGAGRVYVGRWQDGIFSFLLVGALGALSAQGFYESGTSSVRGWVLAVTTSLLYVGNVYGSAVGALAQRREAEDALFHEVDRAYQRRIEP